MTQQKKNDPVYWSRWRFTIADELREVVSQFCFEQGANGLIEHPDGLEAFFSADRSLEAIQGAYTVFLTALTERGLAVPAQLPLIEPLPDQDWNQEWKNNWRAMQVTERIWIRPSWQPAPEPTPDCLLEIDPEMAFGTGTHASTRLSLVCLEQAISGGESVLDVGTGSGILAIAAIKLNAQHCIALDNDPLAVETARHNAEKNAVDGQIDFFTGTLDALRPTVFDRIVANIQRSVLLPLLPDFYARLCTDGELILSGLLDSEEQEISDRLLQLGFYQLKTVREAEWIAVHGSKTHLSSVE